MAAVGLAVRTMMLMLMQADAHQENIVLAKAKKLEADGLVNFITTNEVRYITEYNQVVGPSLHHYCLNVFSSQSGNLFPLKLYFFH